MNSNAESFIVEVESLISDDELPDPLNDIFSFFDLKDLVTQVYEEVLEGVEYPSDGTAEEQADAIREFTEQVAMKVGVIAALSARRTDSVPLKIDSYTLTKIFSNLLKQGEFNITLSTE